MERSKVVVWVAGPCGGRRDHLVGRVSIRRRWIWRVSSRRQSLKPAAGCLVPTSPTERRPRAASRPNAARRPPSRRQMPNKPAGGDAEPAWPRPSSRMRSRATAEAGRRVLQAGRGEAPGIQAGPGQDQRGPQRSAGGREPQRRRDEEHHREDRPVDRQDRDSQRPGDEAEDHDLRAGQAAAQQGPAEDLQCAAHEGLHARGGG